MKVRNMYENQDLYQIIYGRSFDVKSVEVNKMATMLAAYKTKIGKDFPISIAEPFSGLSEHEKFWQYTNPKHEINNYYSIDLHPNSNPNVIIGDIRNVVLPEDVNVTTAHYFSPHFIMDEKGEHSFSALVEAFANIYNQLIKHKYGASIWHITNVDLLQAVPLHTIYYVEKDLERLVLPTNPLYHKHKADIYSDPLYLKGEHYMEYDRVTQVSFEYFKKLALYKGNKKVETITVEQPLTYRIWSENSILEAMSHAGWSNMMFFNSYYDSDVYSSITTELPRVYSYDDITTLHQNVTDVLLHV